MRSYRINTGLLVLMLSQSTGLTMEFQNLSFDDTSAFGAMGRPIGDFAIELAMPGWTLSTGAEQRKYITVNLPGDDAILRDQIESLSPRAALLWRWANRLPTFLYGRLSRPGQYRWEPVPCL